MELDGENHAVVWGPSQLTVPYLIYTHSLSDCCITAIEYLLHHFLFHSQHIRVCVSFLNFRFSFSRIFVYHKLHPRSIAHANNSVNVDQRHWQRHRQRHRSHYYYCYYSKSLPAIVNWKNVCIRTHNRMKELAERVCDLCCTPGHTSQSQTRTSYMCMCCSTFEMLMLNRNRWIHCTSFTFHMNCNRVSDLHGNIGVDSKWCKK